MPGAAPWPYPEPDRGTPPPVPDRVDVAVIGGGLTGLALGRAVSAAGGDVMVFEAGRVGSGATRHGLGILTPHYPGGPSTVMRHVGGGKATALWLAVAAAAQDASTVIDGDPTDIVTRPSRRSPPDVLEHDAAWLRERNFDAEYRSDTETLVTGGTLVDPLELALALGDAIEKEGGVVGEGVTVTSLSRHTRGYQVLSTAGKTTADAVVVATGALHTQRGVHAPGRVVLAADRYGAILQIGLPGALPGVVRSGPLTVRPLGGERAMIAAHIGIPSGLGVDEGAERLVDLARTRLPELGELRVVQAWTAPVGLTADGVPHVWRTDGVWFAGGYNGDAPAASIAVGSELGEVLAGRRTQTIFAGVTPPRRRRRAGRFAAALERRLDG